MSNTTRISVYRRYKDIIDSVNERIGEKLTPREAGMYRWLFEQTDNEQVIIDRIKIERSLRRSKMEKRQNKSAIDKKNNTTRINQDNSPPLTSLALHLRDSETLVKSAEKLGYRVVKQGKPESGNILLESRMGDRLAIAHDQQERLVVHTAQGERKIHELIRQHTIDRTMEHLQAKGMVVNTERLANGELQITAKERKSTHSVPAMISTKISADGNASIDIDNVKGKRCEQIANDLSISIGGVITDMRRKNSYYQFPGEPARINL